MGKGNSFNLTQFIDPPSHFWPGYFWLLNDALYEERLLGQLRDMYEHRARSVCLIAEPPEFRPRNLGTRMSPGYLSDDYMLLLRSIVAECDRLGMNYWLYDEGGWPSGGACGRVYERNPDEFGPRVVRAAAQRLEAHERFVVPDSALCAAFESDLGRVSYPGEALTAGVSGETVRVCVVERGEGEAIREAPYVDLFSREVVNTFIELTHERHREYLEGSFGKSIRCAFTDEPSVTWSAEGDEHPSLRWTSDMAEVFREKQGYELIGHLPALLTRPSDDESIELTQVRLDFYDVWSQLFVERYLEPIRRWCREHRMVSGGHFGGDDLPGGNADYGYGHILRALRGLDLPGVDSIKRQTFPGVRSGQFPKYASSVARQGGLPYVLTESFCVCGNGLTPEQMRWVTDQQYLLGANLMMIGCYPYSTRDNLMPGERPHFGTANPLWDYMDIYHVYTARLGYLLSRGKAVCTTAVYYDIRGIWAGASHRERSIKLHDDIAAALLNAQCDFDYVDDDVLDEGKSSQGRLIIGQMSYDTLIVPTTRWMTREAMDGLMRFVAAGGRVIAVGGLPGCDGQVGSLSGEVIQTEVAELSRYVTPVAAITPERSDVRLAKRQWDGGSCYFITSETSAKVTIAVRFDESDQAVLCEPDSGRFVNVAQRPVAGGTEIGLSLESWGSAVVLFGVAGDVDSVDPVARPTATAILELADGWTIKPLRQYRVGEHDFEITDVLDSEQQPVTLGDWKCVIGSSFSGDVEYAVTFDCSEKDAPRAAWIMLGDVRYACHAVLNGHHLGRRVWQPFAFDVSGGLQAGRNELRVTITNTLANALLDEQVIQRWDNLDGPGWHKGRETYDHAARAFEKDSLPSGLFGPVTIEFIG